MSLAGATPSAVTPASALPATGEPATSGEPGGSGAPAGSDRPAASETPATGGIEGTWTVDPSVGSFDDFSGSFVGYRVRETLATIGATEAVGRTPDVTGMVTIEGTSITAAAFTADLAGLRSDDERRGGQLRRQALETGQFPTATFTLTSPVDLGSVPAEGTAVTVTAQGDLELHGVTRPVEVPLQARLQAGVVTVAGSLPIVFADFVIARPESMIVLSVEDRGVMEVQLQLTRG